jgi:sec-independent protein translocase protein TatC
VEAATHTEDDRATTSPLIAVLTRLHEIRRQLLWSVGAVMAGTIISWSLSEHIYALLAQPITHALEERGLDPRLTFTRLTDPFIVYLSVSFLGGIVLATPLLMAQIWRLLSPRSEGRRLRAAFAFVIIATILFLCGLAFGQFVLLPFVTGYLLDLAEGLQGMVTAREYLRFAVRLLLIMGVAAQLPLLSFVLTRLGLLNARTLWRWFPYSVLVAFLLAALITPPDGISQILVAVPLLGLYLSGIAVSALSRPKDRNASER